MELSDQSRVWNRAALDAGGEAPLQGDAALAALLALHGMIMNGGIDHALEVLDVAEFADGIAAFRYFGLDEAACVLEAATQADIGLELLNSKYGALIPDDGALVTAFEKKYAASPDVFAALEDENA